MARVILARSARAHILAVRPRLADAVVDALGILEADPEAGYRLRGRLKGLWSLRVGTYRIIYEVRERGKLVRVCAIRHRAVAYRSDPR
ncbi:MAG: type II toxin-antitoxin system RelE family toxin [Actinomycetota bacterium]